MGRTSPFRLMNTVFVGFAVSLGYGMIGTGVLFVSSGIGEALGFWEAYSASFRTLFSLGLILGTALVVWRSQELVPETIGAAFDERQLSATDFFEYRERFFSRRRSVTFSSEFVAAGFVIFTLCQFPLSGVAEGIMMVAACSEYALGVYVGRKLCYAGLMLQAVQGIRVKRNLFKDRELDEINSYVNVLTTLTLVFVYVHVRNYYAGPFAYDGLVGDSAKVFLVLPAIIATPVLLIFNFYPRMVLRKVYSRSLDVEVRKLRKRLRNKDLSTFERKSYVIEFDKMSRDELRYHLTLTLSDLPIAFTILLMILEPLLG